MVKAMALIGPLQIVDFVSLKSLCSRFTLLFRVNVLLHHIISSELQLADSPLILSCWIP